jgi:hypothetical protein
MSPKEPSEMQGFGVGLRDDFLKRETDRQNRIHREAKKNVEHTNNEIRPDEARQNNSRFTESASEDFTVSPNGVSELMEESAYKIQDIPEMRSALIPLDEKKEGNEWSHPFSLLKADMEPWISYLKGYRKSRLFLESPPSGRHHASDDNNVLSVDFPVRALLELKRINTKVILEPAVRIKGQADYLDLFAELRSCRDPVVAKSLIKSINDAHEIQLRTAVNKGHEMGNQLYDALMGDGYANLVKAWQKVHSRKPTVEELHYMLTTGRLQMPVRERQQAPQIREKPHHPKPVVVNEKPIQEKQREPVIANAKVQSDKLSAAIEKVEAVNTDIAAPKQKQARNWMSLTYLFHAGLAAFCCGVLIAYVLHLH